MTVAPRPDPDAETEWRNGEERSPRAITVRADQLRLDDHLDEGVRVTALRGDREAERVYVTTDSKASSRIVWPMDHQVTVVRGARWRPGLGYYGPQS